MKTFNYFISILFTLLISGTTWGEVIFQDNFDSHPNWSPGQKIGGQSNVTNDSNDIKPPVGYDFYTLDGSAYSNKGHNTLNIDSTHPRGGTGKSFVFWSEVDSNCGAWCNDGMLGLQLPGGDTGYPDIYIRFYIQFQKNWKWRNDFDAGHKFIHMAHHKSTDNKSDFFSFTQNKPRAVWNLNKYYNSSSPDRMSDVLGQPLVSRYDGGKSNPYYDKGAIYFAGGDWGGNLTDMGMSLSDYRNALIKKFGSGTKIVSSGPDAIDNSTFYTDKFRKGMIGDGEWHCIEFRLKMNSAEGIKDGVYSCWVDGVTLYNFTDIDWCMAGGGNPKDRQWNYIWLGGNNINVFQTNGAEIEQWYSIDDFVVSTSRIGFDCKTPVKVPGVKIVH